MKTSSKALFYGGITLGLIYAIGIIITLFSQNILNNLEFNPSGLLVVMMMLFIFNVAPFIPFLFVVYFLCRVLVPRASVYVVLAIVMVLFFVYGYLIWSGEFLHI